MARDKEDSVDIREPFHFALFYILFNELAKKFEFPSDKPEEWKPKLFYNNIERALKGTGFSIPDTAIKNILSKLQRGTDDDNSYSKRNRFHIPTTINGLCTALGERTPHKRAYSWETFKVDYKEVAQKIMKERIDFFSSLKKNQIKILIDLKIYGTSDELQQIKSGIQDRLIEAHGREDVELNIQDSKSRILNKDQAKKIAEKKNVDLVIYGSLAHQDGSKMNLKYLVNSNKVQNTNGIRVSGSTEFEKTSIIQVLEGHLQADIDQAIFWILALKFYLELKVLRALEYLEQIPEEERCDEVWFMMGVCQFDQGDSNTAKAYWYKALDKNPSHQKSRVNLAVLKEHEYRMTNDETARVQIKENIDDLLAETHFMNSRSEIKFKIALIYQLIGKKVSAKEYYKAVVKDESFPESIDAYLLLAMLTTDPEIHKQCIEGIGKSDKMNRNDKISLLGDIYVHVAKEFGNKEIERMYRDKIDGLFPNDKIQVNEVSGKILNIKAEESHEQIEKGDWLDDNDVLVAQDEDAVMSVLYKIKQVEIMRLKLSGKGEGEFANQCLYSYLSVLRANISTDRRLLLHSLIIKDRIPDDVHTIRIRNVSDGRYVDIDRREDEGFVLEKSLLVGWYPEEERFPLAVHIQYQTSIGKFETLESMELMIPSDWELKERVREFSQYLNYQTDEEYFLAIANYLTDFYACTDRDDVKRWLARQVL